MKASLKLFIALACLALAPAAFAKGKGSMQNHHCMKDGTEMANTTKKACKKAGGTWDRMAAAPAAAAAPAPAAAPATK